MLSGQCPLPTRMRHRVGSTRRTRPSRPDAYWYSGKVTSIASLLITHRRSGDQTSTQAGRRRLTYEYACTGLRHRL